MIDSVPVDWTRPLRIAGATLNGRPIAALVESIDPWSIVPVTIYVPAMECRFRLMRDGRMREGWPVFIEVA